MKKQANVPITILVLGIFVICTLAIISFIIAKISARDSFSGIDLINKVNSQVEDYLVNGDLSNLDTKLDEFGNRIFYQEKVDTSIFPWSKDKIVFSLELDVPD